MSTRVWFTTSITSVLLPKLQSELNSAGLSVDGVADDLSQHSRIGVDFISTPSEANLTTAQNTIDTHNSTDLVLQLRLTDYQNLVNNAASIITQLNNGISANASDVTAFAAASTFAAAKPIVANMLNREGKVLDGLLKTFMALRHLLE